MVTSVLFDLDGVLIDSVKLHCRSYIIAMKSLGLEPDIEKIREMMGQKAEEIIAQSSNRPLTKEEIDYLVREKTRWYRKELLREKPIKPGARGILKWCKENGLKLGLATGTRRENVDAFLEILGFNPFDAIVTANDVKRAKPDPEVWLKTLEELGETAENSVAVDDAVFGVEAAKKAGLRVIGVSGTFPPDVLISSGADWVVSNLEEIKKVLGRL